MRLRITSDGYPASTRVVDVDTGQAIEGVVGVKWAITSDGLSEVELTLVGVGVDAIGELREERPS